MTAVLAMTLAVALNNVAAQSSGASASPKITVTGCVQQVPPSPVGTTGTPAAADIRFELTNALPGADGTSPADLISSASTTSMADTYRLDGEDAQLTPHLTHKVEITGTLEARETSPPSGSASRGGAVATAPKIKVQSVKMISTVCP
jgi:hypothetical protein